MEDKTNPSDGVGSASSCFLNFFLQTLRVVKDKLALGQIFLYLEHLEEDLFLHCVLLFLDYKSRLSSTRSSTLHIYRLTD